MPMLNRHIMAGLITLYTVFNRDKNLIQSIIQTIRQLFQRHRPTATVPLKIQPIPPWDKPYDKKPQPAPPPWSVDEFVVAPEEGKIRFHDLPLSEAIMHAVFEQKFRYCTPIQAEILPHTLAGKDAVGRAQTGTGKTAAFLLTIIARLPPHVKMANGTPRALIVAPTRELVIQIAKEARDLGKYSHLKVQHIFGGTDYQKQQARLQQRQVDIVVATPGRLLDFQRQHDIDLRQVEILVLDEADRMLDMGFIPDVRQIVYSTPAPPKRQTLFFSATFNPNIMGLVEQWTNKPIKIEIEAHQKAADTVEQRVYIVTSEQKYILLVNLILQKQLERVMVFANRRDEARKLQQSLRAHGINCALLSGEVSQDKRMKTLENFREGRIRVLVATDVAGRGLHVEGISHVVNYTLPLDAEDYVHRIGRTGRAGETGTSISFACEADAFQIPEIEAYLGEKLSCTHPEETLLAPLPEKTPLPPKTPSPNHKPFKKNHHRRKPYKVAP